MQSCADENGQDQVDWKPIHGFDDFFIGRDLIADTPANAQIIECFRQSYPDIEVGARETEAVEPARLEIWHGDYDHSMPHLYYHYPARVGEEGYADE